jgi:hypothetical protein
VGLHSIVLEGDVQCVWIDYSLVGLEG